MGWAVPRLPHTDNLLYLMKKTLLFACGLLLGVGLIASQTITLDTSKTKEPISPYIYGQFIEHLGKCVNGGLWSEMLDDRKFYYPITDKYNPWGVGTDPQWNTGPYLYLNASPWRVVGPAGTVTMDTAHTYVVDPNADAAAQIGQKINPPEAPLVHLAGDGSLAGISQDGLELVKGREYTGHVRLRGDAAASPVIVQIVFDDGTANTTTCTGLTGDYQNFSFDFTAPSASNNARLAILSKGQGTFEIGAVSLMPADNIDGWRADTIALLKQLDAPIYRWPGGNFVSGYNWRDGIGPDRDMRPARKNPAWKGVEPNDVGIHEYMDLMKIIGAEPYVSVNTGLGTVDAVAQEVEYCNGSTDTPMGKWRAANGHPEPFGVKFFAVGNEMFGNWQLGNMPLEQYVQKHNQVAAAIWAADPNAKLVAVGFTGNVKGQEGLWDETMFKVCSGNMSLISEHVYVKEKPDSVPDHVAQLADAIKEVADAHRVYRQNIPELQGKDIRIAMDEWNYWYGDYLYGELGVRYHLKDALGIAKGLHEYFRNSDLFFMANYAQTVNVIGAIKTTQAAAAFDATALPLVLYRHQFGTIPIEVPEQPAGWDVSAAWTADKQVITIAVVNPQSTGGDLVVDLGATAVKDQAKQFLITNPDPNSFNVPGEPANITIQENDVTLGNHTLAVPPLSVVLYRLEVVPARPAN
jgi:alpha-L-arabinofuranosidase